MIQQTCGILYYINPTKREIIDLYIKLIYSRKVNCIRGLLSKNRIILFSGWDQVHFSACKDLEMNRSEVELILFEFNKIGELYKVLIEGVPINDFKVIPNKRLKEVVDIIRGI